MSQAKIVRDIVKDIVPGGDWLEKPADVEDPEEITEIVFNAPPTQAQLAEAINSAMNAAFNSNGVLRLRGARKNC